ncbi:TPA: hypothetical protein ACFB7U_001628, partial [Neisseria gonorrhoeae]
RCRLNLQTAFLIARRLQARGRCNTRTAIADNTAISKPVIPDNTAISKFVIPAQAEIRTPDAAGIYRK